LGTSAGRIVRAKRDELGRLAAASNLKDGDAVEPERMFWCRALDEVDAVNANADSPQGRQIDAVALNGEALAIRRVQRQQFVGHILLRAGLTAK